MIIDITNSIRWRNDNKRATSIKNFYEQCHTNSILLRYIDCLEDQIMDLEKRLEDLEDIKDAALAIGEELKNCDDEKTAPL